LDTLLGTNGQRKNINKVKNKNNVINAEGGILSQSSDGITANVFRLGEVAETKSLIEKQKMVL
jgi:hypothetical protein